jgi:hypothetical protein
MFFGPCCLYEIFIQLSSFPNMFLSLSSRSVAFSHWDAPLSPPCPFDLTRPDNGRESVWMEDYGASSHWGCGCLIFFGRQTTSRRFMCFGKRLMGSESYGDWNIKGKGSEGRKPQERGLSHKIKIHLSRRQIWICQKKFSLLLHSQHSIYLTAY